MNDFLLAKVAVIWAETPKSATERKGSKRRVKKNENNRAGEKGGKEEDKNVRRIRIENNKRGIRNERK